MGVFDRLSQWLFGDAPKAAPVASAPAPAPAVAAILEPAALARAPLADKYPIVIGAGSTLAYASSVLRLSTTGNRREYVDFLRELLERDGATGALVSSRVAKIGTGRLEIAPADTPVGDEAQATLAAEIATYCRTKVLALPDLEQHIANLGWGSFYGVAACEISWSQEWAALAVGDDGTGAQALRWYPSHLTSIANRRLSYPDPQTWDLHVWDQGQVGGWASPSGPTNGPDFGLNVAHFPGKFVVHTPAYSADYPTREGWGRSLIWLMLFKTLCLRIGINFLERFARIITWATYSTRPDGHPRAALEPDIEEAKAALQTLGAGSLAGAVLADAITLHQDGPGVKAGKSPAEAVDAAIALYDAQAAMIVRGTTFSTQPGKFGTKGTAESGQVAESELENFDAVLMARTLRRDLVAVIVRLNWPDAMHLLPKVSLHLSDPSPETILALAKDAAAAGIAVDGDDTAEKIGVCTIPNTTGRPRRMAPLAPVALVDLEVLHRGEDLEREPPPAADGPPADGESPTNEEAADPAA